MAVVTGQSFGNFQVVRLLGEGGFGEVYEAENPFLQRRAAVKVLHAGMGQDPELVRRFLNEARAASAIRHPNIIDVFDAGVTPDGEPYILMEFLEGDSLQKVIAQQGRLDLATAQEVARQAGSALSAAHAAGIVHRDLKPENLFLVPDPSTPLGFTVKVLDFGIAKVSQREDRNSAVRTQAGLLMGSPAYMSPEQCRDSSDVDHRTDIYSLAIIVYEMLVGVTPFLSKSATEMLVLQITAEPPPLRQHVPDLPENIDRTITRALSKDRELRYSSVDYFVGALLGTYPATTTQGNPSLAAPDDLSERPRSTAVLGRSNTPGPIAVGPLSSRFGLTPAPVLLSSPSVTTLSRATGEANGDRSGSDSDLSSVRQRRWPLVAITGVLVGAAAAFWMLHARPGPSPVPGPMVQPAQVLVPTPAAPTMVKMLVRSSPAGATVVDSRQGTVLGMTPLEKSYPQSGEVVPLVIRLDGYKDKPVTVNLDGNSSTSVDLERAAAPVSDTSKKDERMTGPSQVPSGKAAAAKAPSGRRPIKPRIDEEDEWRVH
jgi:eukaryotic-like serine/threonine-protein kinase